MPFPDICVDDRESCPNEIPTLCFQQQTQSTQTVQLRDKEGKPYVLDADTNQVCFTARDRWNTLQNYVDKEASIIDAAAGMVELTLFEEDLNMAGIWLGEFTVYEVEPEGSNTEGSSTVGEETRVAIYRFKIYLQSEENLTNLNAGATGLTIAEVRLAIRDRCREDNFLLDSVEFSDTEIAWAIRRPIEYWNEIPPPLRPIYTAATFPYRYNWVNGVIGELLSIASHNYERNRLQYAAANLSVDDKDKSAYYLQASDRYLNMYRTWVLQAKKSINMNLAYNSTSLSSFGNRSLTSGSYGGLY